MNYIMKYIKSKKGRRRAGGITEEMLCIRTRHVSIIVCENSGWWCMNIIPSLLTMASQRAVSILYVTAMIGTVGLSLDTLRAVLPLVVKAIMALDLEISAT